MTPHQRKKLAQEATSDEHHASACIEAKTEGNTDASTNAVILRRTSSRIKAKKVRKYLPANRLSFLFAYILLNDVIPETRVYATLISGVCISNNIHVECWDTANLISLL